MEMSLPLAHAQDWLEPLLFAPAFAVVIAAILRDRRRARRLGLPSDPEEDT